MKKLRWLPVCSFLILFGACGDDESEVGEGSVIVTTYGEPFIEEGIPGSEVADDWTVSFSKFEVSIDNVVVGGEDVSASETTIELTTPSSGEGHPYGTVELPAGEYTRQSFRVTKVDIVGTATLADESKTFSWVFDAPTTYVDCEATTEVTEGDEASFEITIHADHLLYDSLVAEEPQLLFQALADADSDEDGDITQEELSNTDIAGYDPGSESGIDNLWTWLERQVQTLGHVDGEGHCDVSATP